jgi:hypothetical protein
VRKQTQTDLLKKISGQKRVEIALRLSDLTRQLSLANIKNQNPQISKTEINKLLLQRYALG